MHLLQASFLHQVLRTLILIHHALQNDLNAGGEGGEDVEDSESVGEHNALNGVADGISHEQSKVDLQCIQSVRLSGGTSLSLPQSSSAISPLLHVKGPVQNNGTNADITPMVRPWMALEAMMR